MKSFFSFSLLLFLASCSGNEKSYDATGTFEAVETIISAESAGKITSFLIDEGQSVEAGVLVGTIDSVQIYLRKKQLEAQISALLSRKPNVAVQLASLEEQLKTAEREKIRVEKLLKDNAATQKQFDDVSAQIEVLKKQIDAQKSTLETSTDGITKDARALYIQLEQLQDQLEKCRIVNPVSGTVLTTFAEENEMTAPGKPLYKIADLSKMILRVYVTGNQLPKIHLNQKVTVFTDKGDGGFNEREGIISWISEKAEFTPKTVQTKDERATLVYAVKVNVPNDGKIKIGMYGEIKFN